MNKYERIKLVKDFELNTEDNILYNGTNDYLDFLGKEKKCSIRTFKNGEVITPHYPIVTIKKAKGIIDELNENGYNIIIAKPIDPKDADFVGVAKKDMFNYYVDIKYGPGTVRQITHDCKIDKSFLFDKYNTSKCDDMRIQKSINNFNRTGLENVIFEFSWYSKPVGYKKDNFICWEITDDGSGRCIK